MISKEGLTGKTKDTILKHKRRIEYFFIVIPSLFIMLGYLINSLRIKDNTNFKIFYKFANDFIAKVTFNIFSISIMSVIILIGLINLYSPKAIERFWKGLLLLIITSLIAYEFKHYLYEFLYQVSELLSNEIYAICAIALLVVIILLVIKKTYRVIIKWVRNVIELFLISSILYLELTGEYEFLFFGKNFIRLLMNGIRFISDVGQTSVLVFLSVVFISLYGKQLRSIMFFLKNKFEVKRNIKDVIKHSDKYPNMEIVQITDKIKMPLLTHKGLPMVAAVVPAFNESATAPATIDSLLNIDYDKKKFFIFVVSDGSTDNTVEVLITKYDMYKTDRVNQTTGIINRNEAKAVYKSRKHKHLILIDKENGGKSDALNLGLEYLPTSVQYMSVIDSDSIVDKYSFRIFATMAMRDDNIVALAGTILPREVESKSSLKSSILSNTQLFDYLSSFHGERGALSLLNAVLIIPGAFGFFDKWTLLELEGYPRDVLAEDGILTVNLHRKKNVIIKFVPEALSYTQVPSTFTDLRKQRMRWFKGLTELLVLFRGMWRENTKLSLVFLDYLFIEWATPLMTPIGLFIIISNPIMITYPIFHLFMLLGIITPIIQGVLCMGIESSYRKVDWSKLVYIPLFILLSPLITLWRNDALLDLGNRNWGFIKRH